MPVSGTTSPCPSSALIACRTTATCAASGPEELTAGRRSRNRSVPATQFFEFIGGTADGATDGDTVICRRCSSSRWPWRRRRHGGGKVAVSAPLNERSRSADRPEAFPSTSFRSACARQGARRDRRRVIADAQARYFGAELAERSLVPGPAAELDRDPLRRLARPVVVRGVEPRAPRRRDPWANGLDRSPTDRPR